MDLDEVQGPRQNLSISSSSNGTLLVPLGIESGCRRSGEEAPPSDENFVLLRRPVHMCLNQGGVPYGDHVCQNHFRGVRFSSEPRKVGARADSEACAPWVPFGFQEGSVSDDVQDSSILGERRQETVEINDSSGEEVGILPREDESCSDCDASTEMEEKESIKRLSPGFGRLEPTSSFKRKCQGSGGSRERVLSQSSERMPVVTGI